jgi:23S rRNA pseudouridine2605 synthase
LKPDNKQQDKTIRLHVYMAQCGVGSRRKCEEYIQEKKVKVNNTLITTPGYKVSPGDIVEFEDQQIHPEEKKIYIALHKPVKYLCSSSDSFHRPLARDFFKEKIKERLFNVGRLDFLSSGLIFFTNDGDFAYRITHPSFEIEKEYLVKTGRRIDESALQRYKQGLEIDGETYILKSYSLMTPYKVKLILVQGKNREIRRVFNYFKIHVVKIHRIRIGIVKIGLLKPGDFRYLTTKEVQWFQ